MLRQMTRLMLIVLVCFSLRGMTRLHQVQANPALSDNLHLHRPNNHVVLDPISDSPLLNRLGLKENDLTKLGQHLTMEQWVKARQAQQQRRTKAPKIEGQKYEYGEKEMEIIPGLLAKVHN
jgi:hypothetical protein